MREILAEYAHAYYVLDKPIVPDEVYDSLYRELQQIENDFPQLIAPDSPTQKVGGEIRKEFPAVRHRVPMMSLQNAYSADELLDFDKRIAKILAETGGGESLFEEDLEYFVEAKVDGLAISVTFENGIFAKGATRGDGQTGEDVSHNIRTIKSLPLKLKRPVDIEIRGEVFYPKSAFEALNERLKESGEKPFANPRNAAAGAVRQQDSSIAASRPLDLFIYSIVEPEKHGIKTQSMAFEFLTELGIKVNPQTARCASIREVIALLEEWRHDREKLDFPVDGAVVKVNQLELWNKLGSTAKAPRAMIAYKWAAESVTTRLLDVEFGISRNGILTPVAILEPVLLMGSTVGRATLHNLDEIARLDLKAGDTIILEKGGDVIPKVAGVEFALRPDNASELPLPDRCPDCGAELAVDAISHNLKCENRRCPGTLVQQIAYFASRNSLDVEGLGEKTSRKLVELGFVSGIADLFAISKRRNELLQIEGFAEISVDKLISEIERTKSMPLERWIIALGIPNIGQAAATELASRFKTLDALSAATLTEIAGIFGFGEATAKSVVEWFDDEENKNLLAELKAADVNPSPPEKAKRDGGYFDGKSVVITGTVNGASRGELKTFFAFNGAKVADSVSKATALLLAGEKSGSKMAKAKELDIEIMLPNELLSLISENRDKIAIPEKLRDVEFFRRFFDND